MPELTTESVQQSPTGGPPTIIRRSKVAATAEEGKKGWRDRIVRMINEGPTPENTPLASPEHVNITHTTRDGEIVRQLNIKMLLQGDWFTGVADLPPHALEDGRERELRKAVTACFENVVGVLEEAMGRLAAQRNAASQMRDVRERLIHAESENEELRSKLSALEDQMHKLLSALDEPEEVELEPDAAAAPPPKARPSTSKRGRKGGSRD